MAKDFIKITGARQHNLKNISLQLPRNRLIVFTGLSGSGKSSLAFDTLFAEGQRKYVESLSNYARQFLDLLQKPEVDHIEGLSPSIAIEQRLSSSNPRSTIATTTELFDYLRVLFANTGQAHCPDSGKPICHQIPSEIIDQILTFEEKTRLMIAAPVVRDEKGEFRDVLERLAREGFVRVRVDGRLHELETNQRIPLDAKKKHSIEVIVDRLILRENSRVRLADSVETALKWGKGFLLVLHQESGSSATDSWASTLFSTQNYSPETGRSFDVMTPRHFSFNSPAGACETCHGLGKKMVFDKALIVPIPEKTLEKGAVAPWRRGGKRMILYYRNLIKGIARHYGVELDIPYQNLPESFRRILMFGSGDEEIVFYNRRAGQIVTTQKVFEGVIPNLERLFSESESESTRKRLKGYMTPQPCDPCHGRRLKPEILAVTLIADSNSGKGKKKTNAQQNTHKPGLIPGLSIMDVCSLSIEQSLVFFQSLKLSDFQQKVANEVLLEIRRRLKVLSDVGLGYLTLNRESGTLSGGEAQRIRLATQIGSGLVGVLYILDEPSIGLHQRDNDRLLATLEGLRDAGNTVVVVEHDEDTIRRADHVVDLGPRAGIHGGEIVAEGTAEEISRVSKSLTGSYLSGEVGIPVPKNRMQASEASGYIRIYGASENNLKNIDVTVPLGLMTCVTGVSGSGKSTLVDDILRRTVFRKWYGSKETPGAVREITGLEYLEKAIVIDQSPIGRTPRSNPATFTGMFQTIRELFAGLSTARIRGYGVGRFSFNVKGGRCEKCQGDGLIKIEMHFLPPVYVTCESCGGRRYNRQTLEIAYKGRNIADVLQMTIDEAVHFFRAIPKIHDKCLTLSEVGLGYLRLGQSATTLSGGEAQRLKIASELSKRSSGRTLYILDEPTTGLHFHDVAKLMEVLVSLKSKGNSLLIIEHNLEVIKCADWVIDLGPEGGNKGGAVLVAGTPEEVASCRRSYTGQYLKKILKK